MSHEEENHAGPKLYWIFAVILGVITYIEWYIIAYKDNYDFGATFLVVSLLALSLVKFVMVVGWYMHLRYDHAWLTQIFTVGLAMGTATAIVLCILMI